MKPLPSRVLLLSLLAAATALLHATPGGPAWAAQKRSGLHRSLKVGVRVAVKGLLKPDGAFLADEIELKHEEDDDEELHGLIDSLDSDGRTFTLVGFTVQVGPETRFFISPDLPADFTDLGPGIRVKVDGFRSPDRIFNARKIRIRRNQSHARREIVGTIEAIEPATRGLAVLRVVGLDVVVNEATELVGARGRGRPIVRQRLGTVDDDDMLFARRSRLGRRVAVAGEVRLKTEVASIPDEKPDTEDREIIPEIFGTIGIAAEVGPLFAYAQVLGGREFLIRSEEGFEEGSRDLKIGEAYLEFRRLPIPRLSLALGRQKFNEEREWFYNKKNLDGVRLLADFSPFTVEASLSRDIFDETHNRRDQERVNLIVQAGYEINDDLKLEAYYLNRRHRDNDNDSPRIVGFRFLGEPGRHLEMWADMAMEGGTRVETIDSITVVRRIRARALDAGFTYRPRVRLDPTFTLSYALGTGEGDVDLPDDPVLRQEKLEELARTPGRVFRQSGLQRNKGKYNGVVSFRYYGEVLDPELTNLGIFTVGMGLRPVRAVSIDLIYHRYLQDEPSRRLHNTDLRMDPLGIHEDLGDELDLVLGYEPSRRFETRLTAGIFRPGPAFEPGAAPSEIFRFQTRFRF